MKDDTAAHKPIWFKGKAAASWVTRFTVGEDYLWDTLLLPYDIRATRAHAHGLLGAGVLTEAEFQSGSQALSALSALYEQGSVTVGVGDEDCHTVIERFITDHAGPVGKKIHTGRSRNDQVLAALRLYLRDALDRLAIRTHDVVNKLCDLADRDGEQILPGYTHFQRAMPSTVALWALGYAELLTDDIRSLGQARTRINQSPLGSAAGYGVPLIALNREEIARELGFERVQQHVTAVQLSRGKHEMHVVHALVQLATTINRMASDLVLYNSPEFGFVSLPDEYCTGSSIMPQKKNPDVIELCRATVHRIIAELQLLMTLPTNLPSGYHRDLQLTKEAVMRAVNRAEDLMEAVEAVLPGVRFNPEALNEATTPDLFATGAALKSVLEGASFRDAYRDTAANPDAWTNEAAVPLGDSYKSTGFPGKTDSGGVRKKAEKALREAIASPE
jgi:argininosuccinate lyase